MVLISFAATAKLICAFVFAYADCWFSHAAAHVVINCDIILIYKNLKIQHTANEIRQNQHICKRLLNFKVNSA